MSDFGPALENTLRHEGGYVHDPDDPGGETYKGVSRRSHPEWDGWQVIDLSKEADGFPANLEDNRGLQVLVAGFYFKEFWCKVRLDNISDQAVANKVFDIAVNCGPATAGFLLQEALGYCGLPVKVDGEVGPKTIAAVNALSSQLLLGELRQVLKDHYCKLAEKNRTLMKYLGGWLKRAAA